MLFFTGLPAFEVRVGGRARRVPGGHRRRGGGAGAAPPPLHQVYPAPGACGEGGRAVQWG